MKRSGQLITLVVSLVFVLSGCAKINLTGGKTGGGGTAPSNSGAFAVMDPKTPPPVNGDWKVSYIYNNEAYESAVTFAQQGKALTGKGEDSAGPFFISSGSVQGTKVRFVKKYADADPSKPSVEYSGDLEWEDDEDYKGWRMGGHYKAQLPDGNVIDDKWVAISAAAEQAMAEQKQAAANPPPQQQQQEQPSQQPEDQQGAQSGGAPHLSGMYTAQYQYNFKKISTKLWLEQDGNRVRGHGVDTNTNEKFFVSKGFYEYPKFAIWCKYVKGHSAAANRELVIKAVVGPGPSLKGETQFGGGWQARIVR